MCKEQDHLNWLRILTTAVENYARELQVGVGPNMEPGSAPPTMDFGALAEILNEERVLRKMRVNTRQDEKVTAYERRLAELRTGEPFEDYYLRTVLAGKDSAARS